jgi:PAS domain-containing protein
VDASGEVFSARPVGRGLSEYVLRHGRRIFRFEEMLALAHGGELDLRTVGTLAVWWLGVPLVVGDQTIGLVAVQSYDASVSYSHADQELLGFAASQIANTLHRRRAAQDLQQANEQLELRVQERTRELRAEISEQNNKLLQKEIQEKQKVEKNLIEKTGQLTAILESSNHLIWTVDNTNAILSFNKNFAAVLQQKFGLKVTVGMQVYRMHWYNGGMATMQLLSF